MSSAPVLVGIIVGLLPLWESTYKPTYKPTYKLTLPHPARLRCGRGAAGEMIGGPSPAKRVVGDHRIANGTDPAPPLDPQLLHERAHLLVPAILLCGASGHS